MNWAMITVLVMVLLAIGGGIARLIYVLGTKYFLSLEARITALEENQKEYQDKMITAIQAIEVALGKMETREETHITLDGCVLQHRRIEDKVSDTITEARCEFFKRLDALEQRLNLHIEKG